MSSRIKELQALLQKQKGGNRLSVGFKHAPNPNLRSTNRTRRKTVGDPNNSQFNALILNKPTVIGNRRRSRGKSCFISEVADLSINEKFNISMFKSKSVDHSTLKASLEPKIITIKPWMEDTEQQTKICTDSKYKENELQIIINHKNKNNEKSATVKKKIKFFANKVKDNKEKIISQKLFMNSLIKKKPFKIISKKAECEIVRCGTGWKTIRIYGLYTKYIETVARYESKGMKIEKIINETFGAFGIEVGWDLQKMGKKNVLRMGYRMLNMLLISEGNSTQKKGYELTFGINNDSGISSNVGKNDNCNNDKSSVPNSLKRKQWNKSQRSDPHTIKKKRKIK